MTEQTFTVRDMVNHAIEGNATKVMSDFDQLVGPRVMQALADKKIELANRIFNATSSEEEPSESEEDQEEVDQDTDNDTEENDDEDSQSA